MTTCRVLLQLEQRWRQAAEQQLADLQSETWEASLLKQQLQAATDQLAELSATVAERQQLAAGLLSEAYAQFRIANSTQDAIKARRGVMEARNRVAALDGIHI